MDPKLVEASHAMMSACGAAAVGFELCARRTQDHTIAVAARSAAAFLRQLCSAVLVASADRGISARSRGRTGDRLRWEWLASTATILDGKPDHRLLSECARILGGVDVESAKALGDGVIGRYRLALAEARSLASASEHMRCRMTAART
ncbi:MAG TPA: hypothetical protein VM925_25200 [Labilithrix sp.]|nr:hypothetical protein [Labilithrix sp.]